MTFLLAAGFWIGTLACLPPTWRVVRRRSAVDYSWIGLAMSLTAMTCVITALIGTGQWLSVAAQVVCYLAALAIAIVKWRTEPRGVRLAQAACPCGYKHPVESVQ